MASYECIHSGQYRPYGDSHTVYRVKMDGSPEEVTKWCIENIMDGNELPEEDVFYEKWRNDEMSMGEYFKGYIGLESHGGGLWTFSIITPYTG